MDTVELRPPRDSDLNDLMDIDLKCFATPWEYQDWIISGSECGICVATRSGRAVGFAAGRHVICEPESFCLLKVGVRKHHRLRRVGSKLMKAMMDYARLLGFDSIHTVIAESLAYECHGWLARFGFRATGVTNDAFINYGTLEDAIRFDKPL
ncbi:MAG: GNAT family N-acetyltransferase [Phycisphaerales bacterium]|nr:GNAT family N-acetyltransferase [Phycisphaerales bacterium]